MAGVNSLVQIRDFFGSHPSLAEFSTQKGFGELLGRSDAFVRRLEKGTRPITPRIAKLIETIIGVDRQWILSPAEGSIVAKGGGIYTHEMALLAVEGQVQSAFHQVQVLPETSNSDLRRLVLKEIEEILAAEAAKGSYALLGELLKLAKKGRKAK
ncbi:MAG: helix-turn-helix transcriptional regulator [Akkermansiaceae bacterium]|nr:helix-turn-helix transcriptional regulator [Akkermansiaceae bacterium]